MRLLTAFAAASLAFATPVIAAEDILPSKSDEISADRKAGAWTIFRNETSNTCFASYESEDGYVVQFGFAQDAQNGYIGLFSKDLEVEEGTSEIAIVVNETLYTGEATGLAANLSGYQGGYIIVNNPEFVNDVEKGKQIVAFPDSPRAYVISMKGAKNAVYLVRKCTEELQSS